MNYYKRENYLRTIRGFYEDTGLIKVITGVRRCGKSCLMETIADEMRNRGIDDTHIVYLDLDRRPYKNVKTPDQLEQLIDDKTPSSGVTYLFIDEIQNVKGFGSQRVRPHWWSGSGGVASCHGSYSSR